MSNYFAGGYFAPTYFARGYFTGIDTVTVQPAIRSGGGGGYNPEIADRAAREYEREKRENRDARRKAVERAFGRGETTVANGVPVPAPINAEARASLAAQLIGPPLPDFVALAAIEAEQLAAMAAAELAEIQSAIAQAAMEAAMVADRKRRDDDAMMVLLLAA